MGNEQGVLAQRMAAGQPTLPRLQSVSRITEGLRGEHANGEDANAAAIAQRPGGQACVHLLNTGQVAVGDRFITWNSSGLDEPSLLEAKVVSVFDRETDAFAIPEHGPETKTRMRCVVLEYRAELDLIALKSSVARAQQAMEVEEEWREKLSNLGLNPGATAQLWVPKSKIVAAAEPKRRRSSLRSYLKTPSRSVSQQNFEAGEEGRGRMHATSLSEALEAGDELINTYKLVDDDHEAAARELDDDGSIDGGDEEFTDAINLESSVLTDNDGPGDIYTYTLLKVEVRWQFQDAVVDLHVSRQKENGLSGPSERLPYTAVRTMLENAKVAVSNLEAALDNIKRYEGISVGAKVDLWIPEHNTNVRAEIADMRHKFLSMTQVELQPTVKYFVNGRKVVKDFDDYMSFTQAWKQAKYVTEQQLMLTQEAFERGVIAGKTICIHQPAKSKRWAFKDPGALDADVLELVFKFDAATYTVSMQVVVKYKYIGPDKKTKRRVSLHDEQMSLQTYEWDTLIDLLRSKVVISDISCSDISDGHGQKASPYVKFTVGPSKQKTSVKANEIHPQWEGLSLTFREAEDKNRKRGSSATRGTFFDQVLEVRVYDNKRRAFRGLASIPLEELVPSGTKVYDLPLGPEVNTSPKKDDNFGRVKLALRGTGPGVTHARSKSLQHSGSNTEFSRKVKDGMDLFLEAYGGGGDGH